jgi:bifunctional non-homologous end joining protein LigD
MRTSTEFEIAGNKLSVSNLDKVLYPKTGFTKGDVIDYYIRVSPYLLPHLKDRPITLKRYPEGVEGFCFYEKECPSHRPVWIKTTKVPRAVDGDINYCVLNDLPALVWVANLADLELHTFLHRAPAMTRPTALVFDLDPGPSADIITCCEVATWLKAIFDGLNLECWAKTSGSKGLQVYVPLNTSETYKKSKAFAHAIAEFLETRRPETVVSKMQKKLRLGKVLVDWGQNDSHKTTVSVYSLRAKESPSVSTPLTWKSVSLALKKNQPTGLSLSPDEIIRRAEREGDLFAPVLSVRQKLPQIEVMLGLEKLLPKRA